MAKFLLLIVVIAVIYMLVRASNRRGKPPPARLPEAMTRCAHCGLHFPREESLREGERDYCCEDHRRLGARL